MSQGSRRSVSAPHKHQWTGAETVDLISKLLASSALAELLLAPALSPAPALTTCPTDKGKAPSRPTGAGAGTPSSSSSSYSRRGMSSAEPAAEAEPAEDAETRAMRVEREEQVLALQLLQKTRWMDEALDVGWVEKSGRGFKPTIWFGVSPVAERMRELMPEHTRICTRIGEWNSVGEMPKDGWQRKLWNEQYKSLKSLHDPEERGGRYDWYFAYHRLYRTSRPLPPAMSGGSGSGRGATATVVVTEPGKGTGVGNGNGSNAALGRGLGWGSGLGRWTVPTPPRTPPVGERSGSGSSSGAGARAPAEVELAKEVDLEEERNRDQEKGKYKDKGRGKGRERASSGVGDDVAAGNEHVSGTRPSLSRSQVQAPAPALPSPPTSTSPQPSRTRGRAGAGRALDASTGRADSSTKRRAEDEAAGATRPTARARTSGQTSRGTAGSTRTRPSLAERIAARERSGEIVVVDDEGEDDGPEEVEWSRADVWMMGSSSAAAGTSRQGSGAGAARGVARSSTASTAQSGAQASRAAAVDVVDVIVVDDSDDEDTESVNEEQQAQLMFPSRYRRERRIDRALDATSHVNNNANSSSSNPGRNHARQGPPTPPRSYGRPIPVIYSGSRPPAPGAAYGGYGGPDSGPGPGSRPSSAGALPSWGPGPHIRDSGVGSSTNATRLVAPSFSNPRSCSDPLLLQMPREQHPFQHRPPPMRVNVHGYPLQMERAPARSSRNAPFIGPGPGCGMSPPPSDADTASEAGSEMDESREEPPVSMHVMSALGLKVEPGEEGGIGAVGGVGAGAGAGLELGFSMDLGVYGAPAAVEPEPEREGGDDAGPMGMGDSVRVQGGGIVLDLENDELEDGEVDGGEDGKAVERMREAVAARGRTAEAGPSRLGPGKASRSGLESRQTLRDSAVDNEPGPGAISAFASTKDTWPAGVTVTDTPTLAVEMDAEDDFMIIDDPSAPLAPAGRSFGDGAVGGQPGLPSAKAVAGPDRNANAGAVPPPLVGPQPQGQHLEVQADEAPMVDSDEEVDELEDDAGNDDDHDRRAVLPVLSVRNDEDEDEDDDDDDGIDEIEREAFLEALGRL